MALLAGTMPDSAPLHPPPTRAAAPFRAALACLVAAVGWACWVPDTPAELERGLPEGVTALLAPDTVRVEPVAEGVWYHYLWSPRGPWAVHLVSASMDECRLGLEVVRAPVEEGADGGRATVASLVEAHDARVLAAVNGDFFTPEGRPIGPEVVRGDRRTGRERPALASRGATMLPWIGTTGVSTDSVTRLGWRLAPGGPGAVQVLGGWPQLLQGGEPVGDLLVSSSPTFAANRQPRTAVGVSTDDAVVWMVVVDGRQPGYSEGMSLPELAELLTALGVEEGLNLDGGGSSVLLLGDEVVSRPSGLTGPRAVANALLLVADARFCTPPSE
jgi:hypothetical protein